MAKKKLKVGLYPGSFNPWHDGHSDVLSKALEIFDKVIVAQELNPHKEPPRPISIIEVKNVEVITYDIRLSELIDKIEPTALIGGLRDPNDFLAEQKFQYLLEDFELSIPICYFISDRNFVHISSTLMRSLDEDDQQRKT